MSILVLFMYELKSCSILLPISLASFGPTFIKNLLNSVAISFLSMIMCAYFVTKGVFSY